jgi:hypothetical protein
MDKQNRVVSTVSVHNDKFSAVGFERTGRRHPLPPGRRPRGAPSCRLVDNHNHIVLLGIRPGYHTPLETRRPFSDIRATYQSRIAQAPAGAVHHTIGGFNPVQFAEKRLPTLAELDAIAPANPVYLQVSFTGPATTTRPADRSSRAAASPSRATARSRPTARPSPRSTRCARSRPSTTRSAARSTPSLFARSSASPSNFDMGGFLIPARRTTRTSSPSTARRAGIRTPPTTRCSTSTARPDEGARARLLPEHGQRLAIPILTRRVENAFREFGNDWLKIAGLGEFITNWPLFGQVRAAANYRRRCRRRRARLDLSQHTLSAAEDNVAISAWEHINATMPIARCTGRSRTRLTIDAAERAALKALGRGVALHGFRYLAGTPTQRRPVPHNPRQRHQGRRRLRLGADLASQPVADAVLHDDRQEQLGRLINAGQTLTRHEALRLYTAENGWFSKEEDKLGSIETGKLADLVVPERRLLQRLPTTRSKHSGRC